MQNVKKIFGVRSALLGDMITALPVLGVLERKYPNSYKTWFIQKKCSQAAPLFINHPLIDKIMIGELDEGLTEEETIYRSSCDIKIETSPKVIDDKLWYNLRNHIDESVLMAGFKQTECIDKIPRLNKWFKYEKIKGTVAIWAFSGYGKSDQRNPSISWWAKACEILMRSGFRLVQLGHDYDPPICKGIKRLKKASFFDQVRFSLGCEFVVGTDSGSQWVIGAYGAPQIILFTNWSTNHWTNLESLCPSNCNDLQVRLFGPQNCDNIPHNEFESAMHMLSHKCVLFSEK